MVMTKASLSVCLSPWDAILQNIFRHSYSELMLPRTVDHPTRAGLDLVHGIAQASLQTHKAKAMTRMSPVASCRWGARQLWHWGGRCWHQLDTTPILLCTAFRWNAHTPGTA
jgi:hypothetical protein